MLYIVNIAHNPNMASCNRLLGYYAALDEMAIDTTVVFCFLILKRVKLM